MKRGGFQRYIPIPRDRFWPRYKVSLVYWKSGVLLFKV